MSEREMTTHVQLIGEHVIVTFPEPIFYMRLTPEAAKEFGALLISCAQSASCQDTVLSS